MTYWFTMVMYMIIDNASMRELALLGLCILLKQHGVIEMELYVPQWLRKERDEDDSTEEGEYHEPTLLGIN